MKSGVIGILFILAAGLLSCSRQDAMSMDSALDGPAKNYFSSNIDGVLFVPCSPYDISSSNEDPLQSKFSAKDLIHVSLEISANNQCDANLKIGRRFLISFDSLEIKSGATYKLGTFLNNSGNRVGCQYSEDLYYYNSDSSLPGSVHILNYDKAGKTISGSLEATLKRIQDDKQVTITQCRFEISFQ